MDGGASSKNLKAKINSPKHEAITKVTSLVNSPRRSGYGTDLDTNLDRSPTKILDSPDVISISSSIASSDDCFQVDHEILFESNAPINIPKPNRGTKPLPEYDNLDVSSEALYRLEERINESSESTSSDITHESVLPNTSPTQYPRVQVMDRAGGFDPNRIPASVFNRSPGPMDWSVASNDSLFSIHFEKNGVSNFKRSQELLKSGELYQCGSPFKSGELYEPREFCKSSELQQSAEVYKSCDAGKPDEFCWSNQAFPLAVRVESRNDVDVAINMHKELNHRATETIDESENYFATNAPRDFSIDKHESVGSKTATRSPAVPKKKKSACRAFCCCKWSIWCCKWSSCSCKCLRCSGCSCKWFTCRGSCCKWSSCKGPKCSSTCCYCCKKSKPKDHAMTHLTF